MGVIMKNFLFIIVMFIVFNVENGNCELNIYTNGGTNVGDYIDQQKNNEQAQQDAYAESVMGGSAEYKARCRDEALSVESRKHDSILKANFIDEKDSLIEQYNNLKNEYLKLEKVKNDLKPKYDSEYDNNLVSAKAQLTSLIKNRYSMNSPEVQKAIKNIDIANKELRTHRNNNLLASNSNTKYKETIKNMKEVENKLVSLKRENRKEIKGECMETVIETRDFLQETSDGEVKNVLTVVGILKNNVSATLVHEMKRRSMTRKEFSKLLGISFPTFKKLINDPHSQSMALIERIFKTLTT